MFHVKSNRYAGMHLIYAIIYAQKDFKHFQVKLSICLKLNDILQVCKTFYWIFQYSFSLNFDKR